mmetsp:Transcript_58310/g.142565  ORF Transcript_58310/g.142565 Transcript_58310/m.142565 type:complete len:205 (-) Transcript_58310:1379-1993(-)
MISSFSDNATSTSQPLLLLLLLSPSLLPMSSSLLSFDTSSRWSSLLYHEKFRLKYHSVNNSDEAAILILSMSFEYKKLTITSGSDNKIATGSISTICLMEFVNCLLRRCDEDDDFDDDSAAATSHAIVQLPKECPISEISVFAMPHFSKHSMTPSTVRSSVSGWKSIAQLILLFSNKKTGRSVSVAKPFSNNGRYKANPPGAIP